MQIQLPDVPKEFMGEPEDLGEYEGFQLYPMPTYTQFSVPNPEETAKWYVDALGFGIMFYTKPQGSKFAALVHLRRRKYQDILLVPGPAQGGAATFDATGELEDLAARAAKYMPHQGIQSDRYSPPMLRLTDPDGHQIAFFKKPDVVDPNRFKRQ